MVCTKSELAMDIFLAGSEEGLSEMMSEFKKSYKENGRYDLKSQVPYLSRLADIYVSRSESSSLKWGGLLKVQKPPPPPH